ncbi:MAG: Tex-like N-terminal domain-containing protein, partial [Desulfobacteraceae bacterium]
MEEHQRISTTARELNLSEPQVRAVDGLLRDGGTVPFIARYRKEATGSLDEVAVTAIRDTMARLEELDRRRQAIQKSLTERELLTPELEQKINAATSMSVLEDIYLPYRPKRRTKASMAKEKGLEPLAQTLFAQQPETDPRQEAEVFVDPSKGVGSVEDALIGSRHIMAEWISESQEAREQMRTLFRQQGVFRARVIPGQETAGAKFRD